MVWRYCILLPMRLPPVISLTLCLFFAFGAIAINSTINAAEPRAKTALTVSVRDTGAVADGQQLDTEAINRAITQCAENGGGVVVFPAGKYLAGTILLRSHVTLRLDAGSEICGSPDLEQYRQPEPEKVAPFRKWGKWHRALILGQDVEDVTLCGEGTINGNFVYDPKGEENLRGPHAVLFINSRQFAMRDLAIRDAANYAVLFLTSEDAEFQNLKISGGWDGIHFRGTEGRICKNVNITGCRFYTGDDSIAGSYWENTVISNCIVNTSCNGIRLLGPAKRLIVQDCLFYGIGTHPYRTSNHWDTLCGILLQPGAWEPMPGELDDVLISNVTMHHVGAPLQIWSEKTCKVGRVTVSNLRATGANRFPVTVESWMEAPMDYVAFRDCDFEFAGGAAASASPMPKIKEPRINTDTRPLPVWGFYALNVRRLAFENVRFHFENEDRRPVMLTDGIGQFEKDGLKYPKVEGVERPVVEVNALQK